MNHWINAPLVLQGPGLQLVSLLPEHIPDLVRTGSEKSIWRHYAIDGSDGDKLSASLRTALTERLMGLQFPFAIWHKKEQKVIGSTRYLELQPSHRKLEIGWTWLHPDYWGTTANTECKLLLLTHAFETLQAVRVQLKTDVLNERSQKAIEKVGGVFEGLFRNDMVRDNGSLRNSVYYSIIAEDWPRTKERLRTLLQE